MSSQLKSGVSITDITPPEGVELAGYPHCPRNNTGVHDPLYASCIYLDDGNTRLALVCMDLLIYSKKYVKLVRDSASLKTGIPACNIMICCVHSHSAPWSSGRLDLEAIEQGFGVDEAYISQLNEKLVLLIADAARNPFPAKVGIEKGYCGKEQGVGGNRRIPSGTADPSVWVLGVQDLKGDWKGCLVRYALHPTVLQSENMLVSADYVGYARGYLSKTMPGTALLFAQGTSGDQSTRYFRSAQDFGECRRIGEAIGAEVDRILRCMTMMDETDLCVVSEETEIPLRTLPPRKTAEQNVAAAKQALEKARNENASYIDLRNAELKVLGAEDILGYVRLQVAGKSFSLLKDEMPAEIQVIGIGDARIVCVPGEFFVEYGLEIAKRSPFKKTFVIELANGGLPGYVYTPDALKDGGYETDTSMVSPETGGMIVEKALKLLE